MNFNQVYPTKNAATAAATFSFTAVVCYIGDDVSTDVCYNSSYIIADVCYIGGKKKSSKFMITDVAYISYQLLPKYATSVVMTPPMYATSVIKHKHCITLKRRFK